MPEEGRREREEHGLDPHGTCVAMTRGGSIISLATSPQSPFPTDPTERKGKGQVSGRQEGREFDKTHSSLQVSVVQKPSVSPPRPFVLR